MTAIPHQSSTFSARLTSLLSGVLMSAIVLTSIPGVDYTTHMPFGLVRTPVEVSQVQDAKPVPQPKAATFSQDTVAAYLSRDWKLDNSYASQVASAFMTASRRHGVDPLLLMAVAATESSFNHAVGNPDGGHDPMKPYGIMQVAGRYHTDLFPGGAVKATSVGENVDIGARVLKKYLQNEGGNERRALLRYNGSLHVSDKYFQRVNQLKRRLMRGLMAQRDIDSDDEPA
jgi:soluble lytic murein transglycosylase-like protein